MCGALLNRKYPDKMLQNKVFHGGCTVLDGNNHYVWYRSLSVASGYVLSLLCTINHPKFIVSNQMEKTYQYAERRPLVKSA